MRAIRTAEEPACFTAWRDSNPAATWQAFKDANGGLEGSGCTAQVFGNLALAQFQLCAFCEIRLSPPLGAQVEHWHPKSDRSTVHNWALDFDNLMAACEGGVRADIPDGRAVHPIRETMHCGAAKEGKDWTNALLDPRKHVPSQPALFEVRDDGRITVRDVAAPELKARAEATITKLNLNSKALLPLRKARWDALTADVAAEVERLGGSIDAARAAYEAAAVRNLLPTDGTLIQFWTTARSYFGNFAEDVIGAHPELT